MYSVNKEKDLYSVKQIDLKTNIYKPNKGQSRQ